MRVGAFAECSDSAGADEFGWLKSTLSAAEGPVVWTGDSCFGESTAKPFESNDSGGRKVPEFCGEWPFAEPCCLWIPSIWAGSDCGRCPRGGTSEFGCAESYEFDRMRVNAGFGGR